MLEQSMDPLVPGLLCYMNGFPYFPLKRAPFSIILNSVNTTP